MLGNWRQGVVDVPCCKPLISKLACMYPFYTGILKLLMPLKRLVTEFSERLTLTKLSTSGENDGIS